MIRKASYVAAMTLSLGAVACAGGDGETADPEWCNSSRWVVEEKVDSDDPVITYDFASEWVDGAPEGIRSSTEIAASHLKMLPSGPHPRPLLEAIDEIEAYVDEHCEAA